MSQKIIRGYIRKDQVNIHIIRRMGEARTIIPQNGFKFQEEDISHDYNKQKELFENVPTREYPLFEFQNGLGIVEYIGKLESLKEWLEKYHEGEADIEQEDIGKLLEVSEDKGESAQKLSKTIEQINQEKEEEEEKEPTLGVISQSLSTVEGIVKYSTGWITSWFYTPTTITPLPDPVNNITQDIKIIPDNNNNNNVIDNNVNNANLEGKNEPKEEPSSAVVSEELQDFKVVQTNWYWRQQNRVIRFDLKNKTMYRYDPFDLSVRAIHSLNLLKDVTCYNSQYFFQLTFQKAENDTGLVYEYYTTSSTDYPIILNLFVTYSSVEPNIQP